MKTQITINIEENLAVRLRSASKKTGIPISRLLSFAAEEELRKRGIA